MDTGELQPSEPRVSAADRAYHYVREAILTRQLPAYEVFSEGLVAGAVGVSRTPVREALLRLQSDGLVKLMPKRGAMVLPVTDEERADVIETRHLVETFAIRKVITAGHTAKLIDDLEALVEAMRQGMKHKATAAYVEADRAFHERIVAAAGNDILIGLYRSLRDRQLRMGVVNLLDDTGSRIEPARMRHSIAEHEQILQAIVSRSLRAAEAAIDSHLTRSAQLIAPRSNVG
jgi:DNA-binding GntR family transcriptional regulator